MLNLTIADVTDGKDSLTGTGAFDIFMQAAMAHLLKEYAEERISGDKYAEAYIAIMNNVLNTATQFAIQKITLTNQAELTAEQKALIVQQTKSELAKISDTVDGVPVAGSVGKQKEVYTAQVAGFKSDALHKAVKLITDTWSVRETSSDAATGANAENKLQDTNIGNAIDALGKSAGFIVS